MGRKKPDQDAAANFFGDSDLDWLDDSEEEGKRGQTVPPASVEPEERMPVAPPPPPSVRTATPLDGNVGSDWASKVSEAPSDPRALANAPTLIFSSVPTLPPQPAPQLSRTGKPVVIATSPTPTSTPSPADPAAEPEIAPAAAPEPEADPAPAPQAAEISEAPNSWSSPSGLRNADGAPEPEPEVPSGGPAASGDAPVPLTARVDLDPARSNSVTLAPPDGDDLAEAAVVVEETREESKIEVPPAQPAQVEVVDTPPPDAADPPELSVEVEAAPIDGSAEAAPPAEPTPVLGPTGATAAEAAVTEAAPGEAAPSETERVAAGPRDPAAQAPEPVSAAPAEAVEDRPEVADPTPSASSAAADMHAAEPPPEPANGGPSPLEPVPVELTESAAPTVEAPRPSAGEPEVAVAASAGPISTATPAPAPARPVPMGPLPTWSPKDGAEGWREVVATAKAEADAASGAGRGTLLTAAGRITLRKLGDAAEAERLLIAALAAGDAGAEARRMLAEVRGAQGRYSEQEQAWLDLASVCSDADRAEAYLEAALIAWRRRDRPAEAVAHLREAAAALPNDFTARALLRALMPAVGSTSIEDRIALLEELARLAEGGIAADARVEQAALAEEARRPDLAKMAYRAALEAEPGHTFAFQRLERSLADDPAGQAQLYEQEAARPGQTSPGWWRVKAARAWLAAGRGDAAVEGFTAAVDAGYGFALRELQGTYLRVGAFRELELVLAREAAALGTNEGKAEALYRLGWLREVQLGDLAGALEAYREAVLADPAASPAADAVVRLMPESDRPAFLDERIAITSDPEERRALQLWAADLAESTGDAARARALFEDVAAGSTGVESELARDGLDRVLQRLNDLAALSQLRRARAEGTTDVNDRAAWLMLAGLAVADRATALMMGAATLDARADHPALAAVAVALELEGQFAELAGRLKAAGEAAKEPERRASYLLRAAQVLSRHGDPAEALSCAEKALQAEPRLRPARWLARELRPSRDVAAEAEMYRQQGQHAAEISGRTWSRFAAAILAGNTAEARADLEAVLADRPEHAGAIAALEVLLVAERDRVGLVGLYRRAIDTASGLAGARLATRSAELLIESGRNEEAGLVLRRLRGVNGAPLRVGARLALQIGSAERAIDLLSGSDAEEDRIERARLLASAGRSQEALQLLLELLGTANDRVGVAARTATVAQQVGDPEAMIKGYATLAQKAKSDALRAAYGAWTAMQLQSAGRDADALEYWQIARKHRPQSTQALLGVVRGLVARKERTKIKPLFADVPGELATVQADALVAVGDIEGAANALLAWADALAGSDAAPERQIAVLLEAERLLASVADWQGAHDALVKRRALCRNPAVQQAADAARRWMLSEELPETDGAWDLFRQLHEERPADRQITDALSRIASARGDVALAIGYLQELADTAPEPKEAARLRRRIGEVYESSGQLDSARQAYLDALDHVHDDRDALEGLRRLAQQAKDWPGLVAVLQREASSADHARQIELRRQIARVTEDKIGDRKVAIDAWRALLELDPKNREGLDHLLKLSEEQGAWALYVETGEVLAQQLTGREQATLLRKVGVACQDRLGREDAQKYFEQAVAVPPPDAEAAARLEAIARGRADWVGAVRALRLQAQADVEPTARVNALLRAARVEIEALHDREAAARSYRQVLELRPDETSALKFMAGHLFEARKYDEALPICERLEPQLTSEEDQEDFDTRIELSTFYYSFAEILRRKGDEESAIPRYEKALALNPTHLPSLEAVAPLYSETQAWDKAERVYRQLLQLTGGQGEKVKVATTYTELGMVERALGQPDKAYKRFTKALEIHPNHVGALKGMALILEDRQDWSNLLNVYNNIIYHATVPDDVIDAYMTKGRILDDQMQRQDKAAQHYQRSLDFDPNQPAAYLRLAELAMRRDGYKEAGDLVDNALKLDPDLVQSFRPLLLAVKAAAWQDSGHTPEAERCLRECKMLEPGLYAALGDGALQDLEAMRRVIKDRLPR